jgi:hypothetical protein
MLEQSEADLVISDVSISEWELCCFYQGFYANLIFHLMIFGIAGGVSGLSCLQIQS